MEVDVWDTYVNREDGERMHFDIIVPSGTSENMVFKFGEDYLHSKNVVGKLDSKQCRLCHSEEIDAENIGKIKDNGFFIYEMEGCL